MMSTEDKLEKFISKVIAGAFLLGLASATATAQPGASAPQEAAVLTLREQALLARGEISGARHVTGTVVAVVPGLGLGHAIQGRWKERGWIFTFGQLVTFGMATVAAAESDLDQNIVTTLAIAGWGGWLSLRVWEVTDAVIGPKRHNMRVRAIRRKAGHAVAGPTVQPFVVPRGRPDGAGVFAGVVVRF